LFGSVLGVEGWRDWGAVCSLVFEKEKKKVMIMLTLVSLCSIREFCDLSIPIIMFDKNSNYVVMKLEEVSV
jgi:predicted CDP-diglyceride synthetase/phosphatidate cytidylyltransferase